MPPRRIIGRAAAALARAARPLWYAVGLCFTLSFSAGAQAPAETWQTLRTAHFNVHFGEGLEPIARRAAASAERAYAKLAPLLKAPRGRIDVAVTDHVDWTNGYAYVSPTPRIIVYARPPVDNRTLRFREDWFDLVLQHEMVHVFQFDHVGGIWRLAQRVFGRQPFLFPSAWAPSWLVEGLAVHYESALGDGGRLEGLAHQPYVNADAADDRIAGLGRWSNATLKYPGAASAYVYSSLLIESMAGRGGAGGIEKFVERTSSHLIPFSFEREAKASFGVSFAEQWKRFADSTLAAVRAQPKTVATGLTTASWLARHPRPTPDGRVLFVAFNGRDVAGLYEIPAGGGAPKFIARRNSFEPNIALGDGRVVFTQSEFQDPWHERADLWVREANGTERQITHGARLFAADARPNDGAVVAAQNVPGTVRLVRVSLNGDVRPITGSSLDTTWSAPRWSHDGTRIAATRWVRGGTMSIVVMDSLGGHPRAVATARATLDEPAWTLDDRRVLFSVNGTGSTAIWSADVATGALRRVSGGSTSLDTPTPTRDGVIAVETRAAGERLVRISAENSARADTVLPSIADANPVAPAELAGGAVTPYRPFTQLLPRFWMPTLETTDENRSRYGAVIGGNDIVGRHEYAAQLQYEPKREETSASFFYRYSGLGLPLIDVAARQTWDHTRIVDSTGAAVGALGRRRRFVGSSMTFVRQRVRNAAAFGLGAEMEFRDFVTYPASLLASLGSPLFFKTLKYPTFTAAATWANTHRPIMSYSPEDGVVLSGSVRYRWRTDAPTSTHSATLVGTASLFKALDFIPGPAHHVLALSASAAQSDERTNTQLEAGGVSGASAEIAPGIVIGDVRRTFFVRGFAPGAQTGIRALGGSAEWRAPIVVTNYGKGFVPFFAQRFGAVFFADAGAAWCPAGVARGTVACPRGPTPTHWMSSAGAELTLDAAVLNYDVPYRLRAGFARPVQGRAYADSPNGSVYFSLGMSF